MKDRTKLLFIMTNLNTGGIATALIDLLNELVNDKQLDISVLLFDDKKANRLPAGVSVIKSNKLLRMLVVSQKEINKESRLLGIFRLVCGGWTKLFGNYLPYKLIVNSYKCGESFDHVIAFSQSAPSKSLYGGCNEVALNRISAEKKITFLHCDYIGYGLNTKYSSRIYGRFDKIAAVSEGVRNSFLKAEPDLADKVLVVHNCHSFGRIRSLADKDPVTYDKAVINLITVARIAVEKGHDRTLKALTRLKNEGYRFVWHIVGGADKEREAEFNRMIIQSGMNDYVIMHGDQENPYRFMKNADFLLVPSYHEAAPMVFAEAECLGVPVVTTKTTSAVELVQDKGIGIVCDNNDEDIYNTIRHILDDPCQISEIKNNMIGKQSLNNDIAKAEFYTLL